MLKQTKSNECHAQSQAAVSLFDRPDVDLLRMLCQQSTSVGCIARCSLALAQIKKYEHTHPDVYQEMAAHISKRLDAARRSI